MFGVTEGKWVRRGGEFVVGKFYLYNCLSESCSLVPGSIIIKLLIFREAKDKMVECQQQWFEKPQFQVS